VAKRARKRPPAKSRGKAGRLSYPLVLTLYNKTGAGHLALGQNDSKKSRERTAVTEDDRALEKLKRGGKNAWVEGLLFFRLGDHLTKLEMVK